MVIRGCFENVPSKKLETKKGKKFSNAYDLTKVNPGDIKNLSKSVTDNEIEVILQSIHTNKSPKGQMGSFISLKKNVGENLTLAILKLFHKRKR